MLRYAQRRVGTHDAEEVVAQTFLTAWRRVQELPPEPLPWLIGVARNVIRNIERSRRRRARLEQRAVSETRQPQMVFGGRTEAGLAQALNALSMDDRETLMLIAWDELDHASAAAVMGWSQANFRLRLHRARKRLRGHLQTAHQQTLEGNLGAPEPAREEVR